jgi:hypothetical protein
VLDPNVYCCRRPCTSLSVLRVRWVVEDLPSSKSLWIILCDHDKVLCHQFWALTAFVSGLKPMFWAPLVALNPSFILLWYKLSNRHHIEIWVLFCPSFPWRNKHLSL